jgi:hypothetical protein
MKTNDSVKATGQVSIDIFGPNGELKEKAYIPNLVVAVGRAYIASRMKDDSSTAMSHMAVGTGAVAADAADTTLGTEANRQLLLSTIVASNVVTYTAEYAAGQGTGALTEAGIFNASSAGTMLCRTVFDVINKAVDDSMTITWTVTLS